MNIRICFFLAWIMIVDVNGQSIELELFANGFSSPLDITHAGDDRLFIVERSGKIKIAESDGTVLQTPFLDIDDIVKNANNQSEQGLLGLAFHPDYATNGFLFLHYIDNSNNSNIVRYQVSPDDPNQVNEDSRELIIEIEQPFANHNGGCLKFGGDGYLYIGMGDGGSGNDPIDAGQRTDTHLGKMLRIDVDNGLPYTVPSDNPFLNNDDVLDEIWALGLRNPWKFSFDRLTGDLWIGDVGQNEVEEIDFQPASSPGGENYGWRCYEGKSFTGNSSVDDCQLNFVDPVYEIFQEGFSGPCSITGGFVYRGSLYSDLIGKYICADYCTGDFYIVEPDGQGDWKGKEIGKFPHAIASFGEDKNGELYIASFGNGGIYRIVGETVATSDLSPFLEDVNIFPNPTSGTAQLSLTSKEKLELEIQLVDVQGKILFSKTVEVNGAHDEILDMEDLPSGSYIIHISSENKLLSKQVLHY